MRKIEEWLDMNKLQLNVNKTKRMLIKQVRKKVDERNLKIRIKNIEIEVVEEIKYLGVIIDRNLRFSAHVNYIGKKVRSKLGLLRRVGEDLTPYARCNIYKAIIAPQFEYCASLLIGISDYDLRYLQKLQNQAMRIILRCNRRTKIKDMLEALKFMNIKQRIEYNVYIMIFKMVNRLCPEYLANSINYVDNINTRQKNNLYTNRCKTSEEQRTIMYKGFSMYNKLPTNIKNEKELPRFRKLIVQFIKNSENERI